MARSVSQRFAPEAVPTTLGATVRAARRGRGWSQAALAAHAGVSRASVYRLEADAASARADTIFRVAASLALDLADLVSAWPEWEAVTGLGHGVRTRERRRAMGVTLAAAAAAAGVSEATMSRFERGVADSSALLERVGEERFSRSEGLAAVLGFADAAEHDEFCRGFDGGGAG